MAPPVKPTAMDRAFLTHRDGVGQLVLVRHGQQELPQGAASRQEDWRDPPLSELGRRQAERVADALAGEPVAAIYTSALRRAADTGAAIAARHGLERVEVEDLAEIAIFKELPAGRTPLDVLGSETLEAVRDRFVEERRWDVYPQGERSDAFRSRTYKAIEQIVAAHPAETVVVACHGGVIAAYLAELLQLEEDMVFRPAHASVHRFLHLGDRRVIRSLNETHHLSAGPEDVLTF